jgi:hypothetical protein
MNRKFLWSLPALFVLALSAQSAEPDRLLPADTEQVVVINVKQIVASPIFKKYALPDIEKQLKDNKEYKQLQEATGLDVLKDVNSVILANSGSTGKKALVIVRGRFDQDKIHKTATAVAEQDKEKLKIGKLGERNLYEVSGNGQTVFATFIDGTTIVASPEKEFVAAAASGKGGKITKDLAAALTLADGKQSIWMAGLIPEEATKALGEAQQGPAQAIKKIKAGNGGLTITDSITVTGTASTGDADAAKEVAKALDGAKGLLTFFAATNEQVKPFADEVLKTLKIKTDQGNVSVSFVLSEEIIKKAVEMIPKP